MCTFMSAVSDGQGKVLVFDVKDIVEQMAIGNPKNYGWNSHTSICTFNRILGVDEDKWNKWEYDPYKKILTIDKLNTSNDEDKVKKYLDDFFVGKNLDFLRNLYNWNSGDRNSGNRNSGNWNSGNWNSGDGALNYFCNKTQYLLFNKPCTKSEADKAISIPHDWFNLCEWINEDKMTEQEKLDRPDYKTIGGYLKVVSYKEAWSKCPKKVIKQITNLKNFDKEIFKDITGIEVN